MSGEQAFRFGLHGTLVGVLTPAARRGDTAVILLNAGLVHHAGPHRLYVSIARALAEAGLTTLRFDFSGIGDSPARPDNLPIRAMVVAEPREAMDALERQGYRRFILMGICSGAYSAFKTACADPRVAGVVQINPQDAEGGGEANTAAWASRYWTRSLFSRRAWLNLLSGRIDYGRLFGTLARQFTGGTRQAADSTLSRSQAEVQALLAAGHARLLYVVSGDDLSRDYVRLLLDVKGGLPSAQVGVETLPDADHLFTRLSDQARLVALLSDWSTRLAAGPASRG